MKNIYQKNKRKFNIIIDIYYDVWDISKQYE